MSLPAVTDLPIPVWEPPPVRRGWPILSWCFIGLAVSAIVLAHLFWHPKGETAVQERKDAGQLALLRFTGKYVVSAYNLTGRSDQQYYQAIVPMNTGSPEQRLDFVVLTGELKSAAAAHTELAELERAWAANPAELTPQEHQTHKILERLYEDYWEKRYTAPSVSAHDRETLRKELGWFGELALSPPELPGAARQAALSPANTMLAVIVALVLVFLTLFPLGCCGLVVLLVLAATRNLRGGLQRGSLHGGIYAETFALWLLLFFAIGVGVSYLPAGEFRILLVGLGNLLSLSVLAWPVLRGIPWRQVRMDIGWTKGRAAVAEPLLGFWTYILTVPLVVVGMVITYLLIILSHRLQSGDKPADPSHPVMDFLTTPNAWLWIQVFFVASIAAPIIEETMFRGVLYRQLRQVTSRWGFVPSFLLSMVVVSFVFAVIHPQGLLAVPALMMIAFGLTLAREWRVSLLPGMVQHGIHNACIIGLVMFVMS